MQTPKEIEESFKRLNASDLEELKFLKEELDSLQVEEISIHNLRKIENVCRSLHSFREKYTLRVINILKNGCILH